MQSMRDGLVPKGGSTVMRPGCVEEEKILSYLGAKREDLGFYFFHLMWGGMCVWRRFGNVKKSNFKSTPPPPTHPTPKGK